VPLGAMPNKIRIALALVKARQADVAEATGIPAPNVSNIVNGRPVMLDTARKLAEFFGCQIEDLFPGTTEDRRQRVSA